MLALLLIILLLVSHFFIYFQLTFCNDLRLELLNSRCCVVSKVYLQERKGPASICTNCKYVVLACKNERGGGVNKCSVTPPPTPPSPSKKKKKKISLVI
uniref:Secreted protein n=1 Tax=Cynoglossus semilaevis TaxID=244447 RepID=A0A3P8W2J3_CYNSE